MTFRTKFLHICFALRPPKQSHKRLRRDLVPRLSLFSKVGYGITTEYNGISTEYKDISTEYLTIIRLRLSEYCRIIPETTSNFRGGVAMEV